MEKMSWKDARVRSGIKTSVVLNALGFTHNASLYSKEKRNSFTWSEAAVLCKLYGIKLDQIKI